MLFLHLLFKLDLLFNSSKYSLQKGLTLLLFSITNLSYNIQFFVNSSIFSRIVSLVFLTSSKLLIFVSESVCIGLTIDLERDLLRFGLFDDDMI